ncbi:MAG: energy-coupling factor transporter transmembrane protein EcfT [Clostridia bacterium]|nr:energy-coupling factor transporter transmembrane protein EcfT [Clostridia bacterium]
MLKDITFGQYYEGNSPVHKTDPRAKIVLLIAMIVFVFLANNIFSVVFAALSVFTLMYISGVPLRMYAKNLKAILPIIIFTAFINVFYGDKNTGIVFEVWKLTVTWGGIYRAFFMATRIILLIFISSALTYTTTPNDLTDAIERLLSPLKYVGLKSAVHILAMMMTITLRFIPTLIEETEKIMNAQKARGADLENGNLKQRVKALIPILIPLLISAIRRSYELAEAMECRCYNGGEGRQRMKQLHFSFRDYIACGVVFAVGAVIILLNILL